jgi:hypothetical protein
VEKKERNKKKKNNYWNSVFTLGKINNTFLAYVPYLKNKRMRIRSPSCVPHPQRLIAGILKPQETAVARQRLAKHIPAAMNTHATTDLLDVFSMRSVSHRYPICSERKVGD